MYDRTMKLLGKDVLETIKSTKILLIGLGGVGGYVFESLVRTGFQEITVIDQDCFDETNLNRQILALQTTLGLDKVEVALSRALLINPNVNIKTWKKTLRKEDIKDDFFDGFDFIIDACDSVPVKIAFINLAAKTNKKLISCMGTANRTHPELLMMIPLKKTSGDPLAKKIRTELKNNPKALKTMTVCSKEIPKKQRELGTICSVPMAAGALLTSYIINERKKEVSF